MGAGRGTAPKIGEGNGLGLPLSRKFAQLLGGDVYVKSETGKGATFFAAIPINFSGQTEAIYVPDARRELDATKLPILVVEDNKEALFIYEKYLKGTRFQVVPATSLKEARRHCASFGRVPLFSMFCCRVSIHGTCCRKSSWIRRRMRSRFLS